MSEPISDREQRAQDLLAEHLRSREASVDAAALVAALKRRVRPAVRTPRWLVRIAAMLLVGVTMLVVFFALPRGQGDAYAAMTRIVAAANEPVDRIYRVTFHASAHPLARLFAGAEILLHTRGDRFFARPAAMENAIAWGSEGRENGLWIAAPLRHFGLRFRSAGPEALADFRSMEMSRILDRLLHDYDLTLTEKDGAEIVDAQCRAGVEVAWTHVRLRTARNRLVVEHVEATLFLAGGEKGTLEIRLEDERSIPDEAYTVAGHLPAGDPVFEGPPAILWFQRLLAR